MTDEAPQNEATPETPEAPAQETAEESVVNFEKRYNDLRPEFDRTKQRYSELDSKLRDPERVADVLAEYGYELPGNPEDTSDEEEFEDPYEPRISAIEHRLQNEEAQRQETERLAAEDTYISNEIASIAKAAEEEFTDDEMQTLGDLSVAMRNDQGVPDVQAAFDRLFGNVLNNRRQKWLGTKKAPQVESGGAASQSIPLETETERADYIDRALSDE